MRNLTNETILVEKFVIEILKNKNYKEIKHVNEKDNQAPIDIIADGEKIDVKFAHPTMISRKKRLPLWDFDLRKGDRKNYLHTDLDFFICVGFHHNNPKKIFLIPFKKISGYKHLRISLFGHSKWNKFLFWSGESV